MSTFKGLLPGRDFPGDTTSDAAREQTPAQASRGVFAEFPGMTPKYAWNSRDGSRERDFTETMARLFVQVGPKEYEKFYQSVAASSPESEPLAKVLAGTNVAVGSENGGAGYVDFLLQSAQHNVQEKMEVVELLSDNHVAYFYGQAAPTFSYSGSLINTIQDDQAMNMLRIYRDMIRGSQLARRRKVVRLRYDGMIVTGAAMNLQWALSAENESVVPFSFSILVKQITILPNDEYGLVKLSEPFASSQVLPPITGVQLNPGTRPVRTTMVPKELTGSTKDRLNENS